MIRVKDVTKVYKFYWGPRALLREIFLRVPSHSPQIALDHISFEVSPGESFGLVGDNGAGKSTLLKILTGTTFPTSGSVSVEGDVSALLELGTGFHPEFTGRENIYFSGALMGLNRQEIEKQEAAIVAFSGLDEFIDRPVKTYSSGMYVRLGFAVATGFDPAVVIIDEALAVGDQSFQKKCTDRILQFKQKGKTIFFCSHNLHQVKALCNRALWLDKGKAMAIGPASEVVEQYNSFCREGLQVEPRSFSGHGTASPDRRGQLCWIDQVTLVPEAESPARFGTGDQIRLDIRARFSPDFPGEPGIAVSLVRNDDLVVYMCATTLDGVRLRPGSGELFEISIVFPAIQLLSGHYHFSVVTTDDHNMQAYDIRERVAGFIVVDPSLETGVLRLEHRWE